MPGTPAPEADRDGEQHREGEPRTAQGELRKAVHGGVYLGSWASAPGAVLEVFLAGASLPANANTMAGSTKRLAAEGAEDGDGDEEAEARDGLPGGHHEGEETQREGGRGGDDGAPGMAQGGLHGGVGIKPFVSSGLVLGKDVDGVVDPDADHHGGDHGPGDVEGEARPAHQAEDHHHGEEGGDHGGEAELPGAEEDGDEHKDDREGDGEAA